MIDPEKFGKEMGGLVREATSPILKRLEALEARAPEKGEPGPKGEPGADGAKGLDGSNGKDAEPILLSDVTRELLAMPELKTLVALLVAEGVAEYIKANPPKDGVNGKDGRDGIDGKHGSDGQKGMDGRDGKDGERGAVGDRGEKGMDGKDGADGTGLAGAMIDREGELIVTTTKGEALRLGKVVGASMESRELSFDTESHEIIERWTVAGKTKEFRYPAMGIRPKGYWSDNTKAHCGDAYTHDGTLWIAKRDTSNKPSLAHPDDWFIGARKGKDGERVPTPASDAPIKLGPKA